MNEDNIIVTVPSYLYDSDGLDNDDQVDLSSDTSEESEQLSGEYEDYYIDIVSGVNSLVSYDELLYNTASSQLVETQLLNNNVNTLNENLISCFHLALVFLIVLVIKMLFGVFNKYLGLGQA